MEVSNASLYDGGSALAEAVLMALSITGRTGSVVGAERVHPEYRQTLATYMANLESRPVTLPTPNGFLEPDDLKRVLDDQTACGGVEHPNFFGCLDEVETGAGAA